MMSDNGAAIDRPGDGPPKRTMGLTIAVIGLFFLFGGITSLTN